MKKICIVTTMWSSINNWIKPFLRAYEECGVDVSIACNMDAEYEKKYILPGKILSIVLLYCFSTSVMDSWSAT